MTASLLMTSLVGAYHGAGEAAADGEPAPAAGGVHEAAADAAGSAPASMFDLSGIWHDLLEHPGHAFERLLPLILIVTGVVIALHLLLVLVTRHVGPGKRERWSLWERLVYLGVITTVAILSVSAFYSVLAFGVMKGWLLMAHLAGAGGFVVLLFLMAATWAHANRLSCSCGVDKTATATDGDEAVKAISDAADAARGKFAGLTKCTFWLMLFTGVATAGTMLLSMLPLFDTHAMHQMLDAHRYAGLALMVATVVHFYFVVLGKLGWR